MLIPTRKGALVKAINGIEECQHIWTANSDYAANQIICDYLFYHDPFTRRGEPIASVQADEDGVRTVTYQDRGMTYAELLAARSCAPAVSQTR